MGEAIWDVRHKRTGFYETIHRGDGIKYQKPVPVYLVTIVGANFGPMLEPVDCLSRMELGDGSSGTSNSSEYYWKKADEIVELGTRLNGILEDTQRGDMIPVPIHSIGFGWPL